MSYVAKTAQQALKLTDFFEPGDSDYSQAFVRAIAEANLHKINIFIPPGTWEVSETYSDSYPTCIRLRDVHGFSIFGVAGVSVIKLAAGSLGSPTNLAILQFMEYSSNINLHDFVIDGNSANVTDPPPSLLVGVYIASGRDIIIDNVVVHDMSELPAGGITFSSGFVVGEQPLASSPFPGDSARVILRNCIIYDCDNGIYLQDQVEEFVHLIDCIVFDVRGSALQAGVRTPHQYPYVLIDGCFFDTYLTAIYTVWFRTIGVADRFVSKTVIRNSSFRGIVFLQGIGEYIVTNCVFFNDSSYPSVTANLNVQGFVDFGLVTNNIFVALNGFGIRVARGLGIQNANLFVDSNFFYALGAFSVTINALKNFTFSRNVCVHDENSGSYRGVEYAHSGPNDVAGGDLSIIDNYFEGAFLPAIQILPSLTDPAGTIGQVRIIGNEIRVTGSTVLSVSGRAIYGGASFQHIPIIARNNCRANPPSLNQTVIQISSIDSLEYRAYVHGGNVGGNQSGAQYLCNDSPTLTGLPGRQGDRCNDFVIQAIVRSINPLTVEPFNLDPGDTLDISINGGATQTVTFTATAASETSGNTEPFALVDASTLTISRAIGKIIDVHNSQEWVEVPGDVTGVLGPGDIFDIFDSIANDGSYTVDTISYDLDSDRTRIYVTGNITGSEDYSGAIKTTGTVTFNTGDFPDIGNATAAQVASVIDTQLPFVQAVDGGGDVDVTSDYPGASSHLQITGGSANSVLGFPTALVVGTGNVPLIDFVLEQDHRDVINALPLVGGTPGTQNPPFAGAVSIRSNSSNPAVASIQILASSTADTKFGYDNIVHIIGGLWIYEGGGWVKK